MPGVHDMTTASPPTQHTPGIAQRVFVIAAVALLLGLAALFVGDTLRTNRIVKRMTTFEPGTPFAEVVTANGEPDVIETVAGSWKYGQRMRRLPENVTDVAVYHEAITPQTCAFLLDAEQRVVEVLVFAGY
jgi:hypothetical protein